MFFFGEGVGGLKKIIGLQDNILQANKPLSIIDYVELKSDISE